VLADNASVLNGADEFFLDSRAPESLVNARSSEELVFYMYDSKGNAISSTILSDLQAGSLALSAFDYGRLLHVEWSKRSEPDDGIWSADLA
jgi:hypothetical protein